MGFLDDICAKLAAEPREPRQIDLALPATPQPKVIPPEALPPRHYRICDRMLPPSFFYGTVDAPIGADGKFLRETILDADAPPTGTVMRFTWHTFPGDRKASGSIVVLAELQAFEAWERHRHEVAYAETRRREEQAFAAKQAGNRAFNLTLGVPVRWQPAQKIALNALYENNGSGARSSTVNHIQVMEPLTSGRIKRGPEDLLCGAKPGSEGLSTTGPYWHDDNSELLDRVSCVGCLKIAERFRCEKTRS